MNPGSHVWPLRFLVRRFPQMAPIVVSRIFWVTRSSEHTPICNNLQNKQENGDGGSATSLMLKLGSLMLKLGSHFYEKFGSFNLESHTLFYVTTFFYQRGRGSAFCEKWVIFSQIGRRRWHISRTWRLVLPFR